MSEPMDDALVFRDEPLEAPTPSREAPWKVLVVDDEDGVHEMTRLVLDDYRYEGRALEFQSAYSASQAVDILHGQRDFAVILLDMVMESETSGLDVVRHLRGAENNRMTRVILRTGHPGSAPEERIIFEYDINDYKEKSELTRKKLVTSLTSALRSYRDILAISRSRDELHKMIQASSTIFQIQSLRKFCDAVIRQFSYLLNLDSSIYYVHSSGFAASGQGGNLTIMAATGDFEASVDGELSETLPVELVKEIRVVLQERATQLRGEWFIAYFESGSNQNLVCVHCPNPVDPMAMELVRLFSLDVGIGLNNLHLNREILDTQREFLFRLGEIVETRSGETSHHVQRVAEMVGLFYDLLKLPYEQAEYVKLASSMHDVGKIGIPDAILLSSRRLGEAEREVMKTHTTIGHSLLSTSPRFIFQVAGEIALSHHERWDGAGYPQGLKGEAIPLSARVTALIDVFDALLSRRTYKEAWTLEETLDWIRAESGKAFDPQLVDLFLANIRHFLEVRKESERH